MKMYLIFTISLICLSGFSQPALIVGSITGSQTICSGSYLVQFTATPPANGTNPTYQWQSSPNNSTWSDVATETTLYLTPQQLTATTYYRLMQNASGTTGGPLLTNTLTVTVTASTNLRYLQNVTINSYQCYSATDTLTVAGSGTTAVFQPGANVIIVPGKTVSFKPGTSIQSGSHLRAYCFGTLIKRINELTRSGIYKVNGTEFTKIKTVNTIQNH